MKHKIPTARLLKIQAVIFDVDGVLTDGSICLLSDGREMKIFNVLDGTGIKYLERAGIKTAILTGRSSDAVKLRARELGIKHVVQGSKVKCEGLELLMKRMRVKPEGICYIGDDLPDVPVMKRVGMAIAPSDARPEAIACAHWVTKACGGRGVAREAAEAILKAQGKWEMIISRYYSDAGKEAG